MTTITTNGSIQIGTVVKAKVANKEKVHQYRPAVVIAHYEIDGVMHLEVHSMTSTHDSSKPHHILYHLPVNDSTSAGLPKQSYIEVRKVHHLELPSCTIIGQLSKQDLYALKNKSRFM